MMLLKLRTIIFWQKAAFDVQYFAANPISSTSEQVWRMGFGVGGLCGGEIGSERRVLYGEAHCALWRSGHFTPKQAFGVQFFASSPIPSM